MLDWFTMGPKKVPTKGKKTKGISTNGCLILKPRIKTHISVSKQEVESIITILQLPRIRVQNKEVSELPILFWKRHAAGIL